MNKEYIAKYKDQLEIKRYAQSTVKTYVSQIKIFLFCVNIDARLVSVYAVLYAPTTERRRAQRGLSSKNIFRSYSSDRLSFISYKFDFFVFLFPRGVRGELEKEKLLIPLLLFHILL